MNISVVNANSQHLPSCVGVLMHSELGQMYFTSKEKTFAMLQNGVAKNEIYVAMDESDKVLGFVWGVREGAFHKYPYLHIIAVREGFRGRGIGTKLLHFFENEVFGDYSKVFLVVGDFNPRAQKLYERLGYTQVGLIPDLYKPGITEHLMMKIKS